MWFRDLTFGLVVLAGSVGADIASADAVGNRSIAQVDPAESRIADFGADLHVELALTRAVPWRVFTLEEPRRVVLDFAQVDFAESGLSGIVASDLVDGLSMGQFAEGWSRLVLALSEPMTVETAGMRRGSEETLLKIQLAPSSERDFAAAAGAPESDVFTVTEMRPPRVAPSDRNLRMVIDSGRKGAAPLAFAKGLRAELEASGIDVTLTRDSANELSLERRLAVARAADPDVFLALHAEESMAETQQDAAIDTFGGTNSSETSGIGLGYEDARTAIREASATRHPGRTDPGMPRETGPRSEALAAHLLAALSQQEGDPHDRPRLRADFAVLGALDIPSVMLEIDFRSNERIDDPSWALEAAAAIRKGVGKWASEDTEIAELRPQ